MRPKVYLQNLSGRIFICGGSYEAIMIKSREIKAFVITFRFRIKVTINSRLPVS